MNLSTNAYDVEINEKDKVVTVTFHNSNMTFKVIKSALIQLKSYIERDYQIKIIGYISKESSNLTAFKFALSLFGHENRIIIENKSRYHKFERRKLMERARELRDKGLTVKEISNELKVPIKTVYRWIHKYPQ
ncbi:MAG: helix-turn-helix domain-containing protein [archaeon GBS-70-058]|mgnify:CR=1 FL=1|nr:helix-turn-helix domain-containing protein [Candidatus Culexarchaeum nevadense]